eukprot:1440552-Prymnesium_polylepis.1
MKIDRGENPGSPCAPACDYREGATKFEPTRDEHCGAITCAEWGRSSRFTLGEIKVVVESENADNTVSPSRMKAALVAESDDDVLQAYIDKLQVRPRDCLRGGMFQLMSRNSEQPMAKPTEIALNINDQQPRGAPTETGSLDPPSD